ncbi:S10 family serine carboxypeptidase-like protein [Novosphingobium terrae]|uniref:S10 family serine carboxypeptidase-like protein n=1 Tax=Novosphingobium terrae TaxID=2726189 RepID=UPI001981F96A|nr:alpha/beta hydrolase [Novosphingobium terrae]
MMMFKTLSTFLLLAAPLMARAEEPVIRPIATHHEVTVAGHRLAYEAIFAQHILKDSRGVGQATISTIAYLLASSRAGPRPVMFVFNGGPGASSSPLQFEGFGPRLRIKAADGSQSISENPYTLLPMVDLVFIDPVGTGLSRVLPGGSGKPYWSVAGDAASVLATMREWLREHHRQASPVFIAGESYGGTRIARMCADADDLKLAGLILISPSFDGNPEGESQTRKDGEAVARLPAMAVAAARHGKGEADRPAAELFDEASAFAVHDYAAALAAGDALTGDRRREIALRVSRFIGLPVEDVLAANLRVDPENLRKALRKPDGLVVGLLDTRVTAPIPKVEPNRPSAANDPALGLGASNVIVSSGITRYMHETLKVPGTEPYVSLTLDVNFHWDWSATEHDAKSLDLAGNVAGLMRAKPRLRVMLIGGYYDMSVPLLGPRLQLAAAGAPMERIKAVALPQGHSVFEAESERRQMSALFGSFLKHHP